MVNPYESPQSPRMAPALTLKRLFYAVGRARSTYWREIARSGMSRREHFSAWVGMLMLLFVFGVLGIALIGALLQFIWSMIR